MRIWGIHKKYKSLSWFENFMGDHITIGRLTVYGENAMNWAVNFKWRKKYLCFTLPTYRRLFKGDEWYLYYSPDGTPTKAVWGYSSKNKTFGDYYDRENGVFPIVSGMLPNEIDLEQLSRLLAYSDKYEISIQFWPKQTVVYIAKDGVDLQDYGGDFDFAIGRSIEYLDRVNGHLDHLKKVEG